ncbi:hypothetical protein HDU76_013722 [Blyttiomyces sp. JEL0837]|nr:hypothetical protein HDU76_013722 [Blyttiomyces sp. JEL0837]
MSQLNERSRQHSTKKREAYWYATLKIFTSIQLWLQVGQLALAIPSSKYRTNITIASFLPYAVGDLYPNIVMEDFMVEQAITEINEDPSILPNTFVNLARVNSWDPDYSDIWPYVDSGGFGITAAVNLVKKNDAVIAAVGEYFSKSAMMFNNNMLITKGFSKVLKSWNVKRIGLVVAFDSLSQDDLTNSRGAKAGKKAERIFVQDGITILTKVELTQEMVRNHDYKEAYLTLLHADARYIFMAGSPEAVSDFYYLSANHSLISPSRVWLGINGPQLRTEDTLTVYGPQITDLATGFVMFNYEFEDDSDPPQVKFKEMTDKLTLNNDRFNSMSALAPREDLYQNIYDCTKTILYGLEKFLKDGGHPPEVLLNKSVTELLLPSAFANTGYPGLAIDPITLDENGDLQIPMLFGTWNISDVEMTDVIQRSNGM